VIDSSISVQDWARFRAKFVRGRGDDCDLWIAYVDKDGYGQFKFKNKHWKAHRFIWFAYNGPIPDETPYVLHTCDTPGCVTLAHLWLGTNEDNMRDKVRKMRQSHVAPKGSANGRTTFTEAIVLEIRARVAAGELQKDVAEEYGVHPTTITKIVRRAVWRHI
jgi:hypothetical protein